MMRSIAAAFAMPVPTRLALACLLGPAFAAPAFAQGYVIIERGPSSETRKEAAVGITSIDGKSLRDPRRSDPLPPGRHVVRVHFESARGVFHPPFQEVEVDLPPCTLAQVVAGYESRTGGAWKPRVRTEPLGECLAKVRREGGK